MTNDEWYLFSGKGGAAGYPVVDKSKKGIQINAYDYSKECSCCGIGYNQKDRFTLEQNPRSKKILFLETYWTNAIFVRSEVKKVFEKERVSGVEYLVPILRRGEEIEDLYQLKVNKILAPGLIPNQLIPELCENKIKDKELRKELIASGTYYRGPWCGQIKYNHPQSKRKALFKRSIFENQPDFVLTSEWFGSGAAADRAILASKKVKDALESHGWLNNSKGALLELIEIQD
jgi:hypothetical protein